MEEKDIQPTHVDQLEEQLAKERARRVDAKVESGQAIRAPITIVTAGPEDADDALVSASADRIAELRMAGERREIILEPSQIFTGVPRPGRDEKYVAKLLEGYATQTVEQRQQEEAAAAAQVESFHEGSKSHEPEPPPAPMPKSVIAEPPSDLQWTGVIAPISGPSEANSAGRAVEGRFGVADFVLFVADAEGRLLTSRVLQPGDDPKAIARAVLRERLKPNEFYADLAYRKPSTW
jgi:hypothetical protein